MTHNALTFYRVLVRIQSVDNKSISCVIPCRVHAKMNMLETDPDKLRFEDWETS
jgi:hypothetical protein